MSLTELLMQAKAKKSQEFLFVVGSEPRARSTTGWESLRKSPGLMTEWKLLQQSFLDDNQKTVLETTGAVVGETALENMRIGFSFFQHESTMKAIIDLDLDGSRFDMPLPGSYLETCLRMKGLVIVSGAGESGQTGTLYKTMQKMGEEKSFMGVVFSTRPFPQMREEKSCFLYHNGIFASKDERDSLLNGVDVVVYDGASDDDSFLEAMALAERGVFVIYSMRAPSLMNALRRCLSVMTDRFDQHGSSRFAEVFSMGLGQYAMPGLGNDRVFAHELLLVKPQIRDFIERQEMTALQSVLTTAPEHSGILTLNQSLLQHLIRRRVDLKTAFETSRDPDHLDQLLKKVGI
ncbi:twitching motility protein PilT [Bdellovibrio sp. HCB288]|uniref:twitching motility protein PilT n=1 Tax=Bdellovibrio sp. HCB288 TaxID=3394355 RepID=UPI0039B49A37